MSGQSGAAQYGGGRRCRGRGGGGARRAGAPPSHRGNAGSAFSTLLRLRGRLGSHLRGLRDRLVPALARRLLLRRQQPDLQLAPGADGDGRCGALRRSGPGLPLATGRERPQASLEASALLPGADSFHPGGSGAGGCFSLPQQAGDTPYVLAAQLAGTDHRPALLLPVAGRLQHTAASLGSYLAPCALQTHPHLLRLRHPPVFHGFVRGRHQREAFLQHNGTMDYKQLPPEAVFANTLGLLIVVFGVLVLGALVKPSWKRPDADSPDSCQPLLSGEH
ncbi:lysosomal membrane ascorbate-dependent ferrireductase CYB561A3 isoform X2 [Phaenicophaeus curvirostris]|uniref:lysosomal membrane ascorbate-dependent ferrireductase CYB561A3 isoform X2 n=1 Tax=Phaenicophaeus curvirostris TaxID=33595 RepID=UPI0037F0AEB0